MRTTKPDDTVSRPTKAVYKPLTQEWQIQCDQSKKVRDCLVTPGATHDSNNCLLFVSRWEASYRVAYHCTAAACSGCAKPVIGYVTYGADYMWHAERSVRAPSVPDAAIPEPPESQSPSDSQHVDLEDPAMNTYALVKQRHELKCMKVEASGNYIRIINPVADPKTMSMVEVNNFYRNKYYYQQKSNGKYEPTKFIRRWLDDESIRTIDDVVVDPTCSLPNVFNLWKPFKAQLLPAVPDADINALVKPMIQHIFEVITNEDMLQTDFVLDFLAHILQHPERKTQVAISLFGAQGCGKGILFDHFREEVLGPYSSFQTANPEHTLLAKHSNGFVNRVFIQIDEVKCLHDHNDKLKNMITCSTLSYEGKNKDSIVVANISNFVFTSNNENALMIPADDRRFVLFRCTSRYVGNNAHFDTLSAHLRRPEVARGIYQYLMGRDLSKYTYSLQGFRPITKYYGETQHACIPVIRRFVSAMVNQYEANQDKVNQDKVNQDKIEESAGRELYEQYKSFHINGNYKFIMTETAFGRDIQRINGIHRKRTKAGSVYEMNFVVIKNFLEESHTYDLDAEL